MKIILFTLSFILGICQLFAQSLINQKVFQWDHGGIVRGDSNSNKIALVFTGDEYVEGLDLIIETLHQNKVKGNFFFTGRLYSNPEVKKSILKAKSDGHYMGPHSNMHLLYNDWVNREKNLVSKDSMINDLLSNYAVMKSMGIIERKKFFIPPFEWWNDSIANWCKEQNIQIINFTPGTITNADYTYPEMGKAYKNSTYLMSVLFEFERVRGLGGSLILLHVGTDPRRKDKFYEKLGEIIKRLQVNKYQFVRVDKLLK